MSEVKVNKISPRSGTTVTLGDSGDTITLASGVSLTGVNATFSGDLTVDTDTLYVDSTNNRVGIGTDNPASKLYIDGSSGLALRIDGTANTSRGILLRNTGTAEGQIQTDGNMHFIQEDAGRVMKFSTSNTEAMRIDSSGNVLVGTTDPDPVSNSAGNATDNGIKLDENGLLMGSAYKASAGSGSVLYLNRTSTNGNLIDLRKNGTSIAGIGINNSVGYYQLYTPGQVGIRGGADDVRPCTNDGSNRDNLTDLGDATVRWRNLYLGGELRIGGTGSANALDDYEEGDWTPTITFGGGSAGQTYGSRRVGKYTKIGRLVQINCFVKLTAIGSSTGVAQITGLPFASSTTDQPMHTAIIGLNGVSHSGYAWMIFESGSGTTMTMYETATSGARTQLTNSDFANNDEVTVSLTYHV